MKKFIDTYIILSLGFFSVWVTSCTDTLVKDQFAEVEVDDSNLVETRLSLDVLAMSVPSVLTRTEDAEITEEERIGTDAERRIDNVWVFQFDATTKQSLVSPQYYDIPSDNNGTDIEALLKPDVSSIVYVVANVGKTNESGSAWSTAGNSATLDDVKERVLPSPKYIAINADEEPTDLSLPMEGESETVTISKDQKVIVEVTRMYSKVEILIGDIPESIIITDVNVTNIPYYCQVGTLAPDDSSNSASYPDKSMEWLSHAFSAGSRDSDGNYTNKLTIYVPENLQGRSEASESDVDLKSVNAPSNALKVDFIADYVDIFTGYYKEYGRHYAVYPGANIYNDYNIRRNHIYRVKFNIYTDKYDLDIPSSNCFVVKPNQSLSFLPYYRTEIGGGYNFTDYLNPEGDEDKKINDSDDMLENVKIIWQSEDAIGDNSNGDKVWIDHRSDVSNEFHRKIHVNTGECGNVLIAAYNNKGEIIWSWHIWVTDNEPANVSNAVVYSTYAWNENGINTQIRVPGYAVMPCNIGALRYAPDMTDTETIFDTYGMLYQWGRKDPFPPMKTNPKQTFLYNYDSVESSGHARIRVFDNSHTRIVMSSDGSYQDNKSGELFFTTLATNVGGTDKNASLKYSINNPTAFISAAVTKLTMYSANNPNYYINRGDWLLKGDECLWGGLEKTEDMKVYKLPNEEIHIWDNYGSNKTIFDPCPTGWRVPPGDIWLGFTKDGLNHDFTYSDIYSYQEINCVESDRMLIVNQNGFTMYLNGWRQGESSFFPTQGSRMASGQPAHGGICGNYHNATTDSPSSSVASDGTKIDRVNILHLHGEDVLGMLNIFETQLGYYIKAVGGPVRCVRDHK